MSFITSTDVCDAIGAALAGLWPDRYLYRDFCPADHQRPSGYLYVTKSNFTPDSALLGWWDMEAQLELFCSTNEYDLSSTEQLRRDQELVLRTFAPPKLQVADRWISLRAAGDGMEVGSAFVRFSARWMDAVAVPSAVHRPGEEQGPKMAYFEINEEELK